MIEKRVNSVFYIGIFVQYVIVKVAKFWSVSHQSEVTKKDGNIDFYQSGFFEDD